MHFDGFESHVATTDRATGTVEGMIFFLSAVNLDIGRMLLIVEIKDRQIIIPLLFNFYIVEIQIFLRVVELADKLASSSRHRLFWCHAYCRLRPRALSPSEHP